MNGLNKIIDEIVRGAEKEAAKIVDSASALTAENSVAARAEHELWKQEFLEPVRQECKDITRRFESKDRQKRRGELLKVRNRMIDEIITEAKAKIAELPDEEYFELLFRLFQKNSLQMDGVICFARAEYAKVPKDFIERCNNTACSIKMSEPVEEISNGFIIKYGNIIQNCSIDSIFESNWQLFRDKVNECLKKG